MADIPKTFKVPGKFNTLEEAKRTIDELVKQIDLMFRYTRSDIEKVEKRLDDGGL